MDDFFRDYVFGTVTPDYNTYLGYAGLRLNAAPASENAWLGASTGASGGRLTVSSVVRDSPAWTGGLNVNDEIIAVDGYRVSGDLNQWLGMRRPGDKITLLISRAGVIQTLPITLGRNPAISYRIVPLTNRTDAQQKVLVGWLKGVKD
jgi:predicted metalloprotease with PDZ domain